MTRKAHQNKEIEKVLQENEGRGWRIVNAGNHAHPSFRMYCPYYQEPHPCHGDKQWCMLSIWGTPRNPSNHARDIKRLVERCEKYKERIADLEAVKKDKAKVEAKVK